MKTTTTFLCLIFATCIVNGQHWNKSKTGSSIATASQTSKQSLDSAIVHIWDDEINNWSPDYIERYFYDEKGQNVLYYEYYWDDEDNQWYHEEIEEFVFDSAGNIIEYIDYEQDDDYNFFREEKLVISYDSLGRIIYELGYGRDDAHSEWELKEESEYTYDEDDRLKNFILYAWESISDDSIQRIIEEKVDYTYDTNDNISSEIISEWDEETGQLAMQEKVEFNYDANSFIVETLEYHWLGMASQWILDDKTEYTRDAYGNQEEELTYVWNSESAQWDIGDSKTDYTYDLAYGLDQLVLPFNDDIIFQELIRDFYLTFSNKPLEMIDYDRNHENNTWIPNRKAICYYSEKYTTELNKSTIESIQLYPNPATNYIKVKGVEFEDGNIKIFDLRGLTLCDQIISNDNIDISNFETGIYIYRITSTNSIVEGKLVKR